MIQHFAARVERGDLAAIFHSLGTVQDVVTWTVPKTDSNVSSTLFTIHCHTSVQITPLFGQPSWRFGVVRVATTSTAIAYLSPEKYMRFADHSPGAQQDAPVLHSSTRDGLMLAAPSLSRAVCLCRVSKWHKCCV